jgi:hypothetical protein
MRNVSWKMFFIFLSRLRSFKHSKELDPLFRILTLRRTGERIERWAYKLDRFIFIYISHLQWHIPGPYSKIYLAGGKSCVDKSLEGSSVICYGVRKWLMAARW